MAKNKLIFSSIFTLFFILPTAEKLYAQAKILFDNRKAETAGNADWIVDADNYNIGYNSSGVIYTGGQEANAQRIPTPAQSGITASTPESYWTGGLSAWAVDLAKKGFQIESLPYNANITYGNTTNVQDLSNYDVYIICEPNIAYTDAEKTAIINFVKNGGGLYMIADHSGADRNFDGFDAPQIFNDLMKNNLVQANAFGIMFNENDISGTYTSANASADSIVKGQGGTVTKIQFYNGATIQLNIADNATAFADLQFNAPANIYSDVLHAHAYFGKGKVAACGDSSVPDDGTGDNGDFLYDGYLGGASGNHKKLLINTVVWLAKKSVASGVQVVNYKTASVYPNPCSSIITIENNLSIMQLEIFSLLGKKVSIATSIQNNQAILHTKNLQAGLYMCKIQTEKGIEFVRFEKR